MQDNPDIGGTGNESAHQRGRDIYGLKEIRFELAALGILARLDRIKRLRNLNGIRWTRKKKFRVTADSKQCITYKQNETAAPHLPKYPIKSNREREENSIVVGSIPSI
jgi:hypothetical protein